MNVSADLAQLRLSWRQDALAGFLVFLIALPLSLGIALASGFPAMAGIITAVIGGLLVSRINSSPLTITGPAAGMIVVILHSVQSLGQGDDLAGYRYTLAAILLSGLLQIVLSFFKAGRLASFFPGAVIHGMLAAIGIMIMIKQLPIMLGVQITHSGSMLNALTLLPNALTYFSPKIALIALIGLCILLGWSQCQHPRLRQIPAPILVIISGIVFAGLFDLSNIKAEALFKVPEIIQRDGPYLISIPTSLLDSFYGPDFGQIANLAFWESVIGITVIGSLETLISTAAVDKLDPLNRHSNLNQDLRAIGLGNTLAGLMGGLPMIAEIIRSSANIEQGGQSRWANFFHGLFLLMFVLLFPALLSRIPLASLAALLVYTGWRLASPQVFAETWEQGKEQLLFFVVTILAVLATNLLAGVMIGMTLKLLLLLLRGVSMAQLFALDYQIQRQSDELWRVQINSPALFCNVATLRDQLLELNAGHNLVVDLSQANWIDHTVQQWLTQFQDNYKAQGGHCELIGLKQ